MKILKFLYLTRIQILFNLIIDMFFGTMIINDWIRKGRLAPVPRTVKQRIVLAYQTVYKSEVLIETGTYLGDMVNAQLHNFETIYSIEIEPKLFKRAIKRFKNKKNVRIELGDSSYVLNKIMPEIKSSCVFWLDGHYSSGITGKGELDCPIFAELENVIKLKQDKVILIDDARCFNGTGDYPTIETIKSFIEKYSNIKRFNISDDVIQIVI